MEEELAGASDVVVEPKREDVVPELEAEDEEAEADASSPLVVLSLTDFRAPPRS